MYRFSMTVKMLLVLLLGLAFMLGVSSPAMCQGGGSAPAPAESAPAPEEDVIDMGEIVVTGTRVPLPLGKSPGNVTVVPKEAIEQRHARNVGELLEDLPGVEIRSFGTPGSQMGAYIRGSFANQVLVLIDGRPLNTPNLGDADLSQIPTDNIERIEVVRGPFSSIYGANAVSGVINIITVKGHEKSGVTVDYSRGAYNSSIGYANIDLVMAKSTGLLLTPSFKSSDGHRRNGNFWSSDINLRLDTKIGNAALSLSGGAYSDRMGNPGPWPSADVSKRDGTQTTLGDDDISSPFDRSENVKQYFDANLVRGNLTLHLYHNRFDNLFHQERVDFFLNRVNLDCDGLSTVTGLDGNYRFPQGEEGGLVIGATTENQDFEYGALESTPALAQVTKTRYAAKRIMNSWYVENVAKAGKLTFSVGVRGDSPSDFANQVSPRAALLYRASDSVNVKAAWGTSYRAPTLNDIYWPDDGFAAGSYALGLTLSPERGKTFEIGLEALFANEKARARLTWFNEDIENLIAWGPTDRKQSIWGDAYWTPQNVNTLKKKGYELEVQVKPNKYVHFSGNYTHNDARQEREEIVVPGVWPAPDVRGMVGREAAFIPKSITNLRLTYQMPKSWYATLSHLSMSERRNYYWDFTAAEMRTKKLDAHALLNLKVGKKFGRDGENEVYAVWDNIGNQQYSQNFGITYWDRDYPMPGSTVRVGARLKF